MTLSSTVTRVTYNGDGSTAIFAINFKFWHSTDLRVIHRAVDGVETVWTEGTHYTVSGGVGETGALTVETAPVDFTPAIGETLTIKDSQNETQDDSLPMSGSFPSTVVEQRLDKLTRMIPIHSEEIARAVLLPETAAASGLKMPEPGAGEVVRYNVAGTSLETVSLADLSLAIDAVFTGLAAEDILKFDGNSWVNMSTGAIGRALLKDADPAGARGTLGLGTAATGDIGADVQPYDAATAKTDAAQTFSAAQRGAIVALADSANIALDLAQGNNFSITLAGNRILDNPNNAVAGQSGVILVVQDASGGRTLAFGTSYRFAGGNAPVLTATPNAVDTIHYYVKSPTEILVSSAFDWS